MFDPSVLSHFVPLFWSIVGFAVLVLVLPSIRIIGPAEVGLVTKRFSFKKLSEDNPVAFHGEAGYQADLLMPGWRWKFWIVYRVDKFPWVQVPAGEIGVVIAQVGQRLPIGAKSAIYRKEFGNFADLRAYVVNGGQKGVQRPVLPPGSLAPIHPVAFLVITKKKVCGIPIDPDLHSSGGREGRLTPASFGLRPDQLEVVRIQPEPSPSGKMMDVIGIITTLEGDPLPAGDIAGRLGGFDDVARFEKTEGSDLRLIDTILDSKNSLHNNYQDFQAFLDNGGRIGLQHDPLLYGAFNLNPLLVTVEKVPMLVIEQGQVAVIKAYVGLPTEDTSGVEFKFGSLVRPGHRGIWRESLRTGKYPINPRCYEAEIVPTYILTLNWAAAVSQAHKLDQNLKTIDAKSREGFLFRIDLQVQIHIPDTQAPRVISIVGTIRNLIDEVLQAAVGNHFRDRLQSMPAIRFIETRQGVQEEAFQHIRMHLEGYQVETKGVYIQDVILPEQLVEVLTQREIANQEVKTYEQQTAAENQRTSREEAAATANMQKDLVQSRIGIDIETNRATARKAQADGEASYITQTGNARGAEVRSVGLARAEAYKAQVEALGTVPTAVVNAIDALSRIQTKFVPDTLVAGGGSNAIDGVAATLMRFLSSRSGGPTAPAATASCEVEKPHADRQP